MRPESLRAPSVDFGSAEAAPAPHGFVHHTPIGPLSAREGVPTLFYFLRIWHSQAAAAAATKSVSSELPMGVRVMSRPSANASATGARVLCERSSRRGRGLSQGIAKGLVGD